MSLFNVPGWSLPKTITPEHKSEKRVNDQNPKSTLNESDQLQSQLELLRKQEAKGLINNERGSQGKASKKAKKNKKKREGDNAQSAPKVEQQQPQATGKVNSKNASLKKQKALKNKVESQGNVETVASDVIKSSVANRQSSTDILKAKEEQESDLNSHKQKRTAHEDTNTKQSKKAKKNLAKSQSPVAPQSPKNTTEPVIQTNLTDNLTPLQRKMKLKLLGSRFRWLNEKLYTTKGRDALELFQDKPELFDEYHQGFRMQVESWPTNPVDVIIDQLKKLPQGTVVADLGCGDAAIGQALTEQTVLSFDLIAKNEKVTACDISNLPLAANSVDVAVFSLSLMGTNYLDFLQEAHRVLKTGGELKIAEVVSRFDDVDEFVNLLEMLGFRFIRKEDGNKMFVMLYFVKQADIGDDEEDKEMLAGLSKHQIRSLKKGAGVSKPIAKLQKKAQYLLKPCLYKKR